MVTSTIQDLCVKPLCVLTPSEPPKWVATSTTDPRYVDLANLALELTKIENVWIEMAIAQRSSAQARYWRGLISDIFLGFTMRSMLEVLQKDIVNVWNMHDPEKFLALLSVLIEDMSDEGINNYPLTEKAVQAIIENPAVIVIAGPTAVVVLFAEWVRGTYKKTKSSVRCLVTFIVDLTLTMDTLFYLVLSEVRHRSKSSASTAHSGSTTVARPLCMPASKHGWTDGEHSGTWMQTSSLRRSQAL
ncbi:hypothetical protein C8R45DRAFT_1047221 [Mycena sanguinolenta]|nr:hypothetical protein C8R45DRAFT_1047221 [Mycena sanguinolenta]